MEATSAFCSASGPEPYFSHLQQFLRLPEEEPTCWRTGLVLARDSMLHRVAMSAVRGAAVLRVCDFPWLAGDRPRVSFLCGGAVGSLAATPPEVGLGS